MIEILYEEKPLLRKPYLVLGFEGWPNAAELSSFSLQFLIEHLGAKRFATIPLEPFYQMTSIRPTGVIRGGKILELRFPGNHFYYKKDLSGKDLIFFYGVEPHSQWDLFCNLILGLAQELEVSKLFTLGGTYDYIPHTLPVRVSALYNHEGLKDEVFQAGLHLTEYTGPISIHTFLLTRAKEKGISAISLWGHAPQYLQARNVKVALSLLKKLTRLTEIEIDFTPLERASDYFDQQVNELVKEDPKLQEVISKLEEAYRRSEYDLSSGKKEEESKEEKVIYIQAYLKRQEEESSDN